MDEKFWKSAPKQYCDNANLAVFSNPESGESFYLALLSGSNAQMHVFSPAHMKRFSQMVAARVKEFEEKYGTIKTPDWTPQVVSPIQMGDLGKEGK
jgi:hypothetical protein